MFEDALAFSGLNQAHNLTNIFCLNVLSNMLLQGSSARVLQCSLLPSYTGAVFHSSGARLRELCQQGGTKLSQADFLLVWRVMLVHYHWNLVIYLSASFVHLSYIFYYIIITPLPTYLPPYLFHMKAGPRLPTSGGSVLILIQSCRSFSEVKHCTGPHLWTLPAAFKKFCSNKRGPVTATSSARNVMRLEQIWAVGRLLLGLHAQKKQCFVLDSWIITVTTEHGATCANSKMRPEDSLVHHDLRFCCMFLPEKGSWQGRLEAQGFRIECWLATRNASSATMSHALEQTNAPGVGVICQGASSAPICVLQTAFKKFCSNNGMGGLGVPDSRTPQMPLAAFHWFLKASKSRSQATSQCVQVMFKANNHIYKKHGF